MLKIMAKRWSENEHLLREKLATTNVSSLTYLDLVKMSYDVIYNTSEKLPSEKIDTNRITVIDNGYYQGTYLFIALFGLCSPSANEYIITFTEYGSCSGCDSLLAITDYCKEYPNDEQISGLMLLCKDIIINTVKPFNSGWRYDEKFSETEYTI